MAGIESIKKTHRSAHAMSYFSLVQRSGLIEMRMKTALKPYDLTHSQLNVLHILANNYPEPMTSKAIKQQLIVASPDITRLLDRLVKKEWVSRETCESNRRELDITITETGLQLFLEVHAVAKEATGNYFKNSLNKEEAVQLYKLLKKIQF